MNKLLTLGLSLEDVIHDYKIVADSVVDDKTYQNADVGILLSNLDDVVKWLEELRELREQNKALIYGERILDGEVDYCDMNKQCRYVRELQSQIPKWHLCEEELPKFESEEE